MNFLDSVGFEVDYFDPVLNILEGHKGSVTGVQWLPNSKDLFISCGTDSELHVYSLAEVGPVRKSTFNLCRSLQLSY